MATSARIDELRKKFNDNPRRYFAPLANEYRKAGDLEQAIFICQEYLPQQPGHMSGHIVYGQALFDAERLEEARAVFETALTLDPENLIALRHLGDIANRCADFTTARSWYQRVLEADPRNEEIALLLNTLLTQPTATVEAVKVDPPTPVPAPAPPEAPGYDPSSIVMTERNDQGMAIERTVDSATLEMSAVAPSREDALPASPRESAHDLIDITDFDIGGKPSWDVTPSTEVVDVGRVADLLTAESMEADAKALFKPDNLAITGFQDDALEPSAAAEPDVAPEPPPASFVTETMARLYLEQGHRDKAIEIYRQLVEERPTNEALHERLDALESMPPEPVATAAEPDAAGARVASGPTIRSFLHDLLWGPRSGTPNGPADAADPSAQSAAESGHDLVVEAQAVEQPYADSTGNEPAPEPTHEVGAHQESAPAAATDAIPPAREIAGSIDRMFVAMPVDEAGTAAARMLADAFRADDAGTTPLHGMLAHRATGELSLDQVFRFDAAVSPTRTSAHGSLVLESFAQDSTQTAASDGAVGTDGGAGTAGSAGSAGSASLHRAEQPGGDDVEEFGDWLEGLKKT